jgi:hypothetical protein
MHNNTTEIQDNVSMPVPEALADWVGPVFHQSGRRPNRDCNHTASQSLIRICSMLITCNFKIHYKSCEVYLKIQSLTKVSNNVKIKF